MAEELDKAIRENAQGLTQAHGGSAELEKQMTEALAPAGELSGSLPESSASTPEG